MLRILVALLLLFNVQSGFSQYQFKGKIAQASESKTIYLSLIEDYRKLGRISMEQVLKKTQTDALGFFTFTGDNLSSENRIYRIHVDECSNKNATSEHFFGNCENFKSILFIANNKDSITFPSSFDNETLCEIISTNKKSDAFLKIDILKDQMAYDFQEFRSEANKKLNLKKWFSKLQAFAKDLNEPLAELYIYDFLSDRKNDTYAYYQKDVNQTDYYHNLKNRLQNKYPNTSYTDLYISEFDLDTKHSQATTTNPIGILVLIITLLMISLLTNGYFIIQRKKNKKKNLHTSFDTLTEQEQNIANSILEGKTNKEIAAELFISISTVKTHINNVYKKLNVSSRKEIKLLLKKSSAQTRSQE